MAQTTTDLQPHVATDPETIRAQMAETRADLTAGLTALKTGAFLTRGEAIKKRKKTMPAKKTSKKPATSAKRAPAKKTTTKRAAASRAGKASARKKKSSVANKAKKVLGEMLTGAAMGAVTGAAEAVMPAPSHEEKTK
jgi:hypothetical protein